MHVKFSEAFLLENKREREGESETKLRSSELKEENFCKRINEIYITRVNSSGCFFMSIKSMLRIFPIFLRKSINKLYF